MTEDQHALFWRLWSNACEYQGWNALPAKECEKKRKEILAAIGFRSATLIDSTQGFDDVKKRFLELAGRVVNERPDAGLRRRVLARIGPALAALEDAGYPQHSLDTILKTRFKVIEGIRTIADLETPELICLSRTLTARLAAWKQQQGPGIQAGPYSAAGTILEDDAHTLCNVNAGHMQDAVMATPDLFFQAG
jgi:hypothetical protein